METELPKSTLYFDGSCPCVRRRSDIIAAKTNQVRFVSSTSLEAPP